MTEEDDSDVPGTGAVFTFGLSKYGENLPSKFWVRDDPIVNAACGEEHTVFVAASGRVFGFGKNEWGQLGLGHNKTQSTPSCMKSLKTSGEKGKLVACGRNHTLIFTESGEIYGCGCNTENQIGTMESESVFIPTIIDGWKPEPVRLLKAGGDFSAAVTGEGDLKMWGSNAEGQLGVGKKVDSVPQPSRVRLPGRVRAVSCGHYHTGVVLDDGRVFVWGEGEEGKLGMGESERTELAPLEVKGMENNAVDIACGNNHTLAVTRDGRVYAWGAGASGQLGLGNSIMQTGTPTIIDRLSGVTVVSVSVGEAHTAVISDHGALYTFGDGRHGKLGVPDEDDFTNQVEPFKVKRFSRFVVQSVHCGGCHTLILARPRSSAEMNGYAEEEEALSASLKSRGEADSLRGSFRARERRRNKKTTEEDLNRTLPSLTHHDGDTAEASGTYPTPTRRLERKKNGYPEAVEETVAVRSTGGVQSAPPPSASAGVPSTSEGGSREQDLSAAVSKFDALMGDAETDETPKSSIRFEDEVNKQPGTDVGPATQKDGSVSQIHEAEDSEEELKPIDPNQQKTADGTKEENVTETGEGKELEPIPEGQQPEQTDKSVGCGRSKTCTML